MVGAPTGGEAEVGIASAFRREIMRLSVRLRTTKSGTASVWALRSYANSIELNSLNSACLGRLGSVFYGHGTRSISGHSEPRGS